MTVKALGAAEVYLIAGVRPTAHTAVSSGRQGGIAGNTGKGRVSVWE